MGAELTSLQVSVWQVNGNLRYRTSVSAHLQHDFSTFFDVRFSTFTTPFASRASQCYKPLTPIMDSISEARLRGKVGEPLKTDHMKGATLTLTLRHANYKSCSSFTEVWRRMHVWIDRHVICTLAPGRPSFLVMVSMWCYWPWPFRGATSITSYKILPTSFPSKNPQGSTHI